MTRTPRVFDALRTPESRRKAFASIGAGLALAGAGSAAAAAGFAGPATSGPAPDSIARAMASVSAEAPQDHAAQAVKGHAVRAEKVRAETARMKATGARKVVDHAGKRSHGRDEAVVRSERGRAARHRAAQRAQQPDTWGVVSHTMANRTFPRVGAGPLPAMDRLTPVGTSGSQSWLPITADRLNNATAIVQKTLGMHMGLRAAVIAVATAMQESTLQNINYGTSDSLGLFQQRPSMGWGSPTQIMNPSYATGAFLNALRTYQANNPGWANQPLWQAAQGVQGSAFPMAYAKWEAQAAQMVGSIATNMV